MTTPEDILFSTLPQVAKQLDFNHLLKEGRMSLYLHRKLYVLAGLRTVGDLCKSYTSAFDFVNSNKGVGKRVAVELVALLNNLDLSEASIGVSGQEDTTLNENQLSAYYPDIASISLKLLNRQGLISNILFNKLCRDAKLQKIGDFHRDFQSVDDFQSKIQSVGKRVISELTVLLQNLINDPAPYLKAVKNEENVYLPFSYRSTDDVFENFGRVVEDLKSVLNAGKGRTNSHYATIIEHFFSDRRGKHRYSMEDVGGLLRLHRERIRQLKVDVVNDTSEWLHKSDDKLIPKHFINSDLKDRLDDVFSVLVSRFTYVITENELCSFLAEQQITISDMDNSAVDLLLELYGISRCGKSETSFTGTDFYVLDPKFDHKSFLTVAHLVISVLKREVVPICREGLITHVNRRLKTHKGVHSLKPGKIPHHLIDTALRHLPEIETLLTDTEHNYQIRYPYLSSNSDRVERVLFELGGLHSFDEILAEMQVRAEIYQLGDAIEESSVKNQILKGSSRVQAHGKLGLYEWVSPKTPKAVKAQSKVDLVKAALRQKGESANLAEIEHFVNAHLTAIGASDRMNVKSTSAIISYLIKGGQLIRLQLGQYILKNWEPRYADEIKNTTPLNPKGKVRAEIVDILTASPGQTLPRRLLSKRLLEAGYPSSTVTVAVSNNPALELFDNNQVSFVKLKDNHSDFLKPRQRDQILKGITDLLSNTNTHTLPLSVVTRKMEEDFSLSKGQFPVIYKIVTANPHLFEKSESVPGQKLLTLLAVPKSSDVSFDADLHWAKLKEEIISKIGQRLSGVLTYPLGETLDVFFNVATLPTGEADLEALDLLPGYIWKFLSGMADEHFEHSLVREIATSIEPYLLKILYLTAPDKYSAYQSEQTKGLSRINYLLSRVQYAHSQRLRDSFFKAKNTRDTAAHTARSWSSADRNERVLACLVQMLYSVNCYYTQLQNQYLLDDLSVVETAFPL